MSDDALRKRIMEEIEYDPETGLFRWRRIRHGRGGVFKDGWFEATPLKAGYRRIQVLKKRYRAQRLAFLLVNGEWPSGEVRFIDGNWLNVAYSNLYVTPCVAEALSHDVLKDVLDYNPETGLIRWKKKVNPVCKDGWFRGRSDNWGHFTVNLFGVRYQVHRLAWFWMTGRWPSPSMEIDHENGDGGDNRFSNLREVTHQQNMQNTKIRKTNKSGVNGVSFESGKWLACISENSKTVRIGLFRTIEEAAEARRKREEELGYHRNHGKRR